jgi:hypothetical protein
MKILSTIDSKDILKAFTGIKEYPNGDKYWFKEGKLHREDGPAIECADGTKYWWIDGKQFFEVIDVTNKLFLGKEKGKYGLEWLKFLTDKRIEEYPIIPGFKPRLIQYSSIEEYVSLHKRIKNENE